MNLPDLRHEFYGATVEEAKPGPRRELVLVLRDMGGGATTRVRFGGIANFDEVREFFARPPADSLHYLRYDQTRGSNPGDLFIEMEFDRNEERCSIRCSNLSVTDGAERYEAG